MALNIKNVEVEALAAEVAHLLGVSKTEAIRGALRERLRTLNACPPATKKQALLTLLERRVWPDLAGVRAPSKRDREQILGYESEGF